MLNETLVRENNELAKTWKDAAVTRYELLPRLAERAEKNHEPQSRWPVCEPKFEVFIHRSNATHGASEGRRSAFARCPKILRPSTVTTVMKYVEGQAIQTPVLFVAWRHYVSKIKQWVWTNFPRIVIRTQLTSRTHSIFRSASPLSCCHLLPHFNSRFTDDRSLHNHSRKNLCYNVYNTNSKHFPTRLVLTATQV